MKQTENLRAWAKYNYLDLLHNAEESSIPRKETRIMFYCFELCIYTLC